MVTALEPNKVWTDESIREAIAAHRRSTGMSSSMLASEIGVHPQKLAGFLDGDYAMPILRSALIRYLAAIRPLNGNPPANTIDRSAPMAEPVSELDERDEDAAEHSNAASNDALRAVIVGYRDRTGTTIDELAAQIGCKPETIKEWILGKDARAAWKGKLVSFAASLNGQATHDLDPVEPAPSAEEIAQAVEDPPAEEPSGPQTVTGIFLPMGFSLFVPPPPALSRPPGLTIAKDFGRVMLSSALFEQLGRPGFLLIATNARTKQVLLRPEIADSTGALRVRVGRAIANSLGRWAKSQGIASEFYEAQQFGDMTDWIVQLS